MTTAEAAQQISKPARVELPVIAPGQEFVRVTAEVIKVQAASARRSLRWRLIGSSLLGAAITSVFLFHAPEFASICLFGIVCYICGVIAGTSAQ